MERVDSQLFDFVNDVKTFYTQDYLDNLMENTDEPLYTLQKYEDILITELLIESKTNNHRACIYIIKCLVHIDQYLGILTIGENLADNISEYLEYKKEHKKEDKKSQPKHASMVLGTLHELKTHQKEGETYFDELLKYTSYEDFSHRYRDVVSIQMRRCFHFYNYKRNRRNHTIEWCENYFFEPTSSKRQKNKNPYFLPLYPEEGLVCVFEKLCEKGWMTNKDRDNWLCLCGVKDKKFTGRISWEGGMLQLLHLINKLFGEGQRWQKTANAFFINKKKYTGDYLKDQHCKKFSDTTIDAECRYITKLIDSLILSDSK